MYCSSGYSFDTNRGLGTVPLSTTTAAINAATASSGGGFAATVLAAFGGPVGLAIMGVMTAISFWKNRKKPQQKIATTQIVNEAEPLLAQNLAAWYQSPKTLADQQAALNNFDIVWAEVVKQCGNPEMGTPGEWCINDRKAGGKWDWFARYRDPIANDPGVVANPTITESLTSSLLPSQVQEMFSGRGNSLLLLLGIGIVGLGIWGAIR